MEFKKIYLEGTEIFIRTILNIARDELGDGCNAIDLDPVLKDEERS